MNTCNVQDIDVIKQIKRKRKNTELSLLFTELKMTTLKTEII